MVENDPYRIGLVNQRTGVVNDLGKVAIGKVIRLKIPNELIFKNKHFLIDGARCSTLNYKVSGALSHLCHHYLHFDTTLLHKKDEFGSFKRLKSIDFESILELKEKATREHINELVSHKVLIKPSKAYRFYVNPRFKIRGGYISYEEFDMLLKHDLFIKDCLDHSQLIQYKSWKRLKNFI
tara:strand:+ start:83 stop:622 length:540 start_codon:yes stop_codon:yes gene_type:complete